MWRDRQTWFANKFIDSEAEFTAGTLMLVPDYGIQTNRHFNCWLSVAQLCRSHGTTILNRSVRRPTEKIKLTKGLHTVALFYNNTSAYGLSFISTLVDISLLHKLDFGE